METSCLARAFLLLLAIGSVMPGCDRGKGADSDTGSAFDPSATPPTRNPTTASIPEPTIEPAPAAAAPVRVSIASIGNFAIPATECTVTAESMLGAQELGAFGTPENIVVAVCTDGSAQSAALGVRLTHEDGRAVSEQSAPLNTDGVTTIFTFAVTKAWPAGFYRLQVTVDGQPVGASEVIMIRDIDIP